MELPVGAHTPALGTSHFPDREHAFVWRNWTLVEPQRLAKVLNTSIDNVRRMAESMGLPQGRTVCTRMLQRGYFTLLRLNWHLLPYEQLLELLDMTVEELNFILREDDFAFIKLGCVKPKCEPVRYFEPDQTVQLRAAQIKRTVQRYFSDLSEHDEQPRFEFIDRLSRVDESTANAYDPSRIHEGLRLVHSYFGVFGDPLKDATNNPFPEGLLARLAEVGVNGVWMHVVLRQLAPGGERFPEFGDAHELRLETLSTLVGRARRFGIGVYLYLNEPRSMPLSFFDRHPESKGVQEGDFAAMCSSSAKVRDWMSEALAHVFHEVPHLAGVFTITGSENLTFCYSHGRGKDCPRCGLRGDDEVISQVNSVIEAGVHRGNPQARVIVWDWGWKGHGRAPQTIRRLPDSAWLMSVSEWSLPISRGGIETCVGEHAISVVGPGPRAGQHWSLARQRGLKTVANVQANCSPELLFLPFLPVMDLVAEHAAELSKERIDGVMLGWSFGGYPSPNLKVFQLFSQRPDSAIDDVLNQIARESYGRHAVAHARKAWSAFSGAFSEFPNEIHVLYYGTQHMGPANLLYLDPTGYAAAMVGVPYDDLDRWRGPYPPDVLACQFDLVANRWNQGLHHFEQVVATADEPKRPGAASERGLARAAGLHFASAANQVRFVVTRDQWLNEDHEADHREGLRRDLITIIEREIELARQLYELAVRDARIGFEASCQYFYVPLELVEQVVNCVHMKKRLLAAVQERETT